MIGACGVVHQQHVVVLEVPSYGFLVERQGGIVLLFAEGLSRGVLPLVVELCGRCAEAEGEDVVDLAEHFFLAFLHGVAFGTSCHHLPEFKTPLAEFEADDGCHLRGVVGIVAFGHHLGRHHAVFADDVLYTGECATVAEGILE